MTLSPLTLNKPRWAYFAIALLLLGWGILPSRNQAWDGMAAAADSPAGLVRIEAGVEEQLQRLAELDLSVYTQLWDEAGVSILLLEADAGQVNRLVQEGFTTRILDPDSSGAAYYLAGRREMERQPLAVEGLAILDVIGNALVVRGEPVIVETLPGFGVPIQYLQQHPLVLPVEAVRLQRLAAITPDPLIASMIGQVEEDTAYDYVGGLSGEWPVTVNDVPYTFATRYSYAETPIKKATKYVEEHFTDLGLNAYFSTFFYEGMELRNVIADQPGVTDPDCLVLLVGHLDSRSETYDSSMISAPGADDNASGTTGVLIGADILSQYDFACTIRYVAFTGEEQGMRGSQDYAAKVYAAGEDITAVVNLDMVAYNSNSYKAIELHTRPGNSGDLAIANLFAGVVQAYGIDLVPEIVQDALSFSDHSSFWNYGYSAILGIEDYSSDFNIYYHKTTDTLDHIDSAYMTKYIRAAIGTVAHLAGPIPLDETYLPVLVR